MLQGEVLDVAVDIRPDSNTSVPSESVLLSAAPHTTFFVPLCFAHGFLVLSETATFFFKCDNFYNKESEVGIIFSDTEINIDWQFEFEKLIISQKDQALPTLSNAKKVW